MAVAALAFSSTASAHYGIPHAFSIVFGPQGIQHVLLRSDIWGFMRSWDGGQTWQWSCAEVYSGNSAQAEYHPMLITASGRTLVGASFDGLRASDNFCDWRKIDAFGGALVSDIAPWSGNDLVLLTSTSGDSGGFDTRLWKSSDDGSTWATVGKPMPSHLIGLQVRAAPSNALRLYVVGIAPNGTVGLLQRSDDGASTWQELDFPLTPDQTIDSLRLPMVHPTRPDVAFVRLDAPEGFGMDAPDSVIATNDGGTTWKTLFASKGDLPGLTLSPDGKTVLIAGPLDGVQSANLDDAFQRGQAAFQQVFSGLVWGLNWASDGTLYAGNNNFAAAGVPAYTLGKSTDGGHTFEPVMNICQIGYPTSCAKGSTLDDRCSALWDTPPTGFGYDFVYGDRCIKPDAGSGTDAGTNKAAAGANTESGCSYAVPGGSDGRAPAALAFAALTLARVRRRFIGPRGSAKSRKG
jgi:hypothetical protein